MAWRRVGWQTPAPSDSQVIFNVAIHILVPELAKRTLGQLPRVQGVLKGRIGKGGGKLSRDKPVPGPSWAPPGIRGGGTKSKRGWRGWDTGPLPGTCHNSLPSTFGRGQRGARTGRATSCCKQDTSPLCGTWARGERYSVCLFCEWILWTNSIRPLRTMGPRKGLATRNVSPGFQPLKHKDQKIKSKKIKHKDQRPSWMKVLWPGWSDQLLPRGFSKAAPGLQAQEPSMISYSTPFRPCLENKHFLDIHPSGILCIITLLTITTTLSFRHFSNPHLTKHDMKAQRVRSKFLVQPSPPFFHNQSFLASGFFHSHRQHLGTCTKLPSCCVCPSGHTYHGLVDCPLSWSQRELLWPLPPLINLAFIYWASTVCSAPEFIYMILFKSIVVFIWYVRILKHRKINPFAQHHRGSKWWKWDLNH